MNYPTPAVVKLIEKTRETKNELKEAQLAVTQLVKLVEYLEEEILEKDELIQELKERRN